MDYASQTSVFEWDQHAVGWIAAVTGIEDRAAAQGAITIDRPVLVADPVSVS